jgi:hypothetical protein
LKERLKFRQVLECGGPPPLLQAGMQFSTTRCDPNRVAIKKGTGGTARRR